MSKIHTDYKLPVQKCIDGESVQDLSDIELLAVIVGTGTRDIDVLELSAKMIKNMGGFPRYQKPALEKYQRKKVSD